MSYEERFIARPRRTIIGLGFSAIAILAVLGVGGGLVFGGLNLLAQPGRVIQKTFDADNMIYNYEWFRTQYADIQAMDAKVAAAQASLASFEASAGPRTDWALSDRQQWDQLNRMVLGLTNQRTTMVATYNGRASQANRSIFMAGLPDFIQ